MELFSVLYLLYDQKHHIMNAKDKEQAIAIVTSSNDITVKFNVPVNNSYNDVYDILILKSNAKVIKQLHDAGFSLSMTEKGLKINNYSY